MRFIFILAMVCFLHSSHATNYYVSSLSGSDSRTASQAQNPFTPWKTLYKLNSFFGSLEPGDSVLLKRGEIFYGSILVSGYGAATSPIVVGAYGAGRKPVVTSLVSLRDWVSRGNGIWESTHPSLGKTLNMVVLNGVQYAMGRYPNKDAANRGYLNFESHVGKTSILDRELKASVNWTGAELVLRPRHWILDRNLITNHSGTKISYTSASPYEPYENYGYFIQNSLKTLDRFGEWYYDPLTKKFSVYFGANNPSFYTLQASTLDDLVSSVKYSNVTFDNLTIKGANGSGFSIINGSNIKIQNCDILYSGKNGIFMSNHTNLEIKNCIISHQNNNGIDIETGDNAIVKNNKVINTYLLAGTGVNGEGMGVGINVNSNNSLIENNEIKNTGYQGIHFNGSDVIIKNNLIDTFCLVKDDGAGIYSNKGEVVYKRRKVYGNIILNGIGTGEGTDDSAKLAAHGIYMDNNASEAEFKDNTIANCAISGFYIHNSFGMTIKNNTVFNNKIQLNMIQDADNVPIRKCVITNNILFSKLRDQWVLFIKTSGDDIKSFGRFDSNYYARPIDERIIIYNSYVKSNGTWVSQSLDLEGWKQTYVQDLHTKRTAKQLAPFTIISLNGENKFVNGGDFTEDTRGIGASACDITRGTSNLLDKGYLQITPSSGVSSFYIKVGSFVKGKNYILSYSLRGSADKNMTIAAYLRQAESPYNTLTPAQARAVDLSRTENELLFSSNGTEASASVVFEVNDRSKYFIDNIKFYETNAKTTDPDDSIRFERNTTATSLSIPLDGSYIDTRGKKYSGALVLAPYTSVILIKTNNLINGNKNAPPTVAVTSPANNAVFKPSTDVLVKVAAADTDGTIAKVEFYNGSTLLKSEFKPGYDCTLGSIATGNYSITAKAYDNNGLATTSAPVKFSVRSLNLAPVVTITSPKNASSHKNPVNITITATANDTDGSVSKVDFFNGTTLLGSEYKPPYTFTWQNVAAGDYTITAKATDDEGVYKTSAPVTLSVTPQQASRGSSTVALQSSSAGLSDTENIVLPPEITGVFPVTLQPGVTFSSDSSTIKNSKLSDQAAGRGLYNFKLAPNPAVDVIGLYFDVVPVTRKATIVIQNTAGAVLKRYPVTLSGKNVEIDISSLIEGTYILSLSGDNFIINKKFLKLK